MLEKIFNFIQSSLLGLSFSYLGIIVLVAFALWTGYQSFDRLSSSNSTLQAQAAPFVPPRKPSQTLTQRLQIIHLFTSEKLSAIPPASGISIAGIFFNGEDRNSRALVSLTGQAPKSYAIGDSVSNGLRLYEIFSDHVLFLQDGDLVKASLNLAGIDFPTELPKRLFV